MIVERKGVRSGDQNEFYVFALLLGSEIEFMIDHRLGLSVPEFALSSNVNVLDARASKYFEYREANSSRNNFLRNAGFGFRDWNQDPGFYEKLIDGHEQTHERWKQIRKRFISEFAPPSVTRSIGISDDGWAECSHCVNIWQPLQTELVVCPECNSSFRLVE